MPCGSATRLQAWRLHGEYGFVLCPPGNGIDTHRTWEALALRSIPIVIRSSRLADRLYEGLPVVLVDSFREVTLPNLRKWHRFYAKLFQNDQNMRRIELRHWEHAVLQRAAAGAASAPPQG